MSLQITKGRRPGAVRAIIYGVEGIGKSTLASLIPGSVTLDVEDGTGQLDIARVLALDWRSIEQSVKDLIGDMQGHTAVIIDTADWLEKALIDWMLRQSGKKSIEDYGYGKGYTILQEHVVRFLALLDQLVAKGIHVIFVAHAKVVRTSPPDQTDGYDRYELKLTKQVAPLLKEWADAVLFCNYKIQIVEGTDGKLKAQGGRDRIMYATRTAAWDAKNRFNLPDEMPMEFAQIAHLFGVAAPRENTPPAPAESPARPATVATTETATPTLASQEQISKLHLYAQNSVGRPMVEAALEKLNAVDTSELTTEQADALIVSIQNEMNKPDEPKPKAAATATPAKETLTSKVPPTIAKWLESNADAVNSYLVRVKWLTVGQTWRDLADEKINSITDKADKFARAAGIAPLGGKAAA